MTLAAGKNKQPPVIDLIESRTYSFQLGSYVPSQAFAKMLRLELTPRILELLRSYPDVSSVEIIGHTDGVPNGGAASNLDSVNIISNLEQEKKLLYRPGSNVDLGLLRALYVKSILENSINMKCQGRKASVIECRQVKYRVYSAGSLIDGTGKISPANGKNDSTRRRIEIRFTR